MKRALILLLILALSLSLCGCEIVDTVLDAIAPTDPDSLAPGRMVMELSVKMSPADPKMERYYRSQERVEEILNMLKAMDTGIPPESEPSLQGGIYYEITLHYTNGDTQNYYLLNLDFLRRGDEPWADIVGAEALEFVNYLKAHPGDEIPETT